MDLEWLARLEAQAKPNEKGEVKSAEIFAHVDGSGEAKRELERAFQEVTIVLLDIFLHLEEHLAPVFRLIDPTSPPRETLCRFIKDKSSAHHEAAQRVLLLAKEESFRSSAVWHLMRECRPYLQHSDDLGPLPSREELQKMKGQEVNELRVRLSVAFADAFDPQVQAQALSEWVDRRFRPQDFVAAAALAEKVMEDPICYDEPKSLGAFTLLQEAHVFLRDAVTETGRMFERPTTLGKVSWEKSQAVRGLRAADVAAAFARRKLNAAGLPTREGARMLRHYFPRVLLNDELIEDV